MSYWSLPLHKVLEELNTSHRGLSEDEAQRRLSIYGLNELREENGIPVLRIFLEQFKDMLVIILLIATVIAYLIGETIDAILIFAMMITNTLLGFIQEYRAEAAIEALKRMTASKATVLRMGKAVEIDATKLVPGDVLELIEGDRVSVDCRIIESVNLQTDESALTGESTPVDKKGVEIAENTRISDRVNMLFSGTGVVRGHAKAVVIATGMSTEVGKIAKEIQAPAPPTPLQVYLDRFGKRLGLLILAVCLLVFVIESMTEEHIMDLFLTSISLALAAIPEGLPVIVTLCLAFGAKKLAGKKALVRKLAAVEALGSATVICTDKTGTLTENRMTVKKVYCDGKVMDVRECKQPLLFRAGLICNNSILEKIDPTEVALVQSAREADIDYKEFFEYKRMAEIPFSSDTKTMTVVCQKADEEIVFMKGAPNAVLARCNRVLEHGKLTKLTDEKRKSIDGAIDEMAAQALRVLAFAYKANDNKKLEENLVFIGAQGMIDPPRREVRSAIAACKSAGIRVIIITGDHPLTAKAVAETIGIDVENIVTGDEVERWSFDELKMKVLSTTIFARVEPNQKNRIVKALKENGEIVAVTGDGVNDAPALKNADIGVAMGIRGTDVAKEASDMIITDDNFATIVSAIEEGRRIFDNIKKSMVYLLSSNLGELLVVFIASLFLLPLPLTAVQLLWINLLTDGFPALALGVDPAGPGIMRRKPNASKSEVLSTNLLLAIIRTGFLIAIACIFLYLFFLGEKDLIKAQTVTFTALVAIEFVILQTVRQQYSQKLFTNKYLSLSLLFVFASQLFILYGPLNAAFHVVPLSLGDWFAIIIAVVTVFSFNHFITKFVKSE